MYVDLHLHSSLSDGSLSPEQLADLLADSGVRYAALTDHDTTAGQRRFRDAAQRAGIGTIAGVEFEVTSGEGPVHFLAYGLDPAHPGFNTILDIYRRPVWMKIRRCLDGLDRRHGSRPEEASPLQTAYQGFGPDGRLATGDAIEAIHQAGGRVFLAHPLSGGFSLERIEPLVAVLKSQGLDGIEAFYKPYGENTLKHLLEIANRFRLLVSAGSDFHHPHAPNEADPGFELPEPYWSRFLDSVKPGP